MDGPALELLATANFGHVATARDDGSAAVTPVWFDFDGEQVLLNGARGRMWVRNIERDPRVTLAIGALGNPYECVVLQGITSPVETDAIAHFRRIFHRYRGRDAPAALDVGERVVFALTIDDSSYRFEPPPGSGKEFDEFLAALCGE
jgi:PPOX class probable F420-dependent enzyme